MTELARLKRDYARYEDELNDVKSKLKQAEEKNDAAAIAMHIDYKTSLGSLLASLNTNIAAEQNLSLIQSSQRKDAGNTKL